MALRTPRGASAARRPAQTCAASTPFAPMAGAAPRRAAPRRPGVRRAAPPPCVVPSFGRGRGELRPLSGCCHQFRWCWCWSPISPHFNVTRKKIQKHFSHGILRSPFFGLFANRPLASLVLPCLSLSAPPHRLLLQQPWCAPPPPARAPRTWLVSEQPAASSLPRTPPPRPRRRAQAGASRFRRAVSEQRAASAQASPAQLRALHAGPCAPDVLACTGACLQ